MSVNAEPGLAERVTGSTALRRRQAVGRGLGRAFGRLEVRGAERIPADGPVVLAPNHRAFLDGPLIFGLVGRPANFLVKVEAFNAVTGPVLRGAGQIPITRHRFDPAPLRLCLRILDAGGVVGLFPEGSRGDGLVRQAKPGVGYFALRTGAVVVPVACHGTEQMAHRRSARRPQVLITFGAPIVVAPVGPGRVRRSAVAAATEQVRSALAALVADTAPGPATAGRAAA